MTVLHRRNFLIGGTAAALSACTPGSSSSKPLIGIAYALGGRGDRSYNDACAPAIDALEENFDFAEFSPTTLDDYPKAIAQLASQKPKIIFCVGYVYDTYVNRLASRYDGVHFVVLDGLPDQRTNTLGVQFDIFQASTLAGIVAADRTKTGAIGFLGGSDIPPIEPFYQGFETGAKRYKPNILVKKTFVGSGADAFTNAARGKDLTLQMINQGADVIFHAAGTSGNGAIAAAESKGVLAIGVDVDQAYLAKDTVITSVLKRLDQPIIQISESYLADQTLPSGVLTLGLKDNGVGIVRPNSLSSTAQTLLDEVEAEFLQP